MAKQCTVIVNTNNLYLYTNPGNTENTNRNGLLHLGDKFTVVSLISLKFAIV